MNRCTRTVYWLMIILIGVLLSACAGGQGSAPTSSLTTIPNADLITEGPTITPTEELKLNPANFEGNIFPDTINGIPAFTGIGTVINDQDQSLQVAVTGFSDSIVSDYLKTAQFYFDIREPVDIPIVNEDLNPFYFSVEDFLKDEKAEKLLISFQVPEEIKERFPTGSLFVVVDPTIKENQAHLYASKDPNTDRADVTITTRQGAVDGTLYLQNIAIVGQTKIASPNNPKTLSGIGTGNFDLIVRGINSGENTYQLIGTWNYDYLVAGPPPYTDIVFDRFPDGTPFTSDYMLRGDEFSSQGIYLAGAPEGDYCANATVTAIRSPSVYGTGSYFLTTSDPNDVNLCNTIPISISFTNPVRHVTLVFAGASLKYTLKAYDSGGGLIGLEESEAVYQGGTFKISFTSESSNISRITFGSTTALTAVTELYFEP